MSQRLVVIERADALSFCVATCACVPDGFQFARLLREYELKQGLPAAPLIALTANALKADVDAYTAASFRWFVPKPFRRSDLHGVLQAVLAATISTAQSPQHAPHRNPSEDDKV